MGNIKKDPEYVTKIITGSIIWVISIALTFMLPEVIIIWIGGFVWGTILLIQGYEIYIKNHKKLDGNEKENNSKKLDGSFTKDEFNELVVTSPDNREEMLGKFFEKRFGKPDEYTYVTKRGILGTFTKAVRKKGK